MTQVYARRMAEAQRFEGEFAKGGPGVSTMPIALCGRGSVELAPEGFVVIGWRKHVSPWLVLAVTVALVAGMFAIGVLVSPDVLGARTRGHLVGVWIVFAAGALAAGWLTASAKLQHITFDVPWRAVRAVTLAQDRVLIVTIRGIRPSGTLHFVPDAGAHELRERIAAHAGQR